MAAKLFFSYSHADEALRNQLEIHLSGLKRQGLIDTWHDRRIAAGDVFENTISEELEAANAILLLISSDFIASRYCYEVETKRALERHRAREARVIPVVLRPCDWHDLPFGKLLALPTDGKPITRWADIDEAFLDVVRGIKAAIAEMGTAAADEPVVMAVPSVAAPSASGPRSSNLRLTKSFTDRDKDDFLHEAFVYIANFFENSLEELGRRNPGIEGRVRRSGDTRFAAAIYRGGTKTSACTIFLGQAYGRGEIRLAHGEQDASNSWNESVSVDADDQTLFLKPLGMMASGSRDEAKLTMQGAAELFWGALIEPLQR